MTIPAAINSSIQAVRCSGGCASNSRITSSTVLGRAKACTTRITSKLSVANVAPEVTDVISTRPARQDTVVNAETSHRVEISASLPAIVPAKMLSPLEEEFPQIRVKFGSEEPLQAIQHYATQSMQMFSPRPNRSIDRQDGWRAPGTRREWLIRLLQHVSGASRGCSLRVPSLL
jgi:hypothetical protein